MEFSTKKRVNGNPALFVDSKSITRRLQNPDNARAGLLTRFCFERLPGFDEASGKECVRTTNPVFGIETYSSGNCCRLSRHSHLIPTHAPKQGGDSETIALQR